jgi:tetratricopeptide (TPR) repeat protein
LGVDPGPELAALHRRLLAAPDATGTAPTAGKGATRAESAERAEPVGRVNTLPYDLPDFTGRREELRRLLEGTGVTAVDGMAGVGKTALVVHAAHRLAVRHPDGQLFCDLHAHTPGTPPLSPEEALAILLTMLGVPAETIPDGLDARTARWRAALAGRRVLVVLDNAASAAQVRPLLPGTPGSRALVTSRRRLGAVEGATVCSLDVLDEGPALALLAAVTGPRRIAAERDAAAEVLRRCGYLPLAIRVAGTRMAQRPLWTVAEAARRLGGERLGELTVHDRGVRPAFALSYGCLDPAQRRMFRLLGGHPGADFDAWSAGVLTGLPPRRAEDLLESLVDVHLLAQPVAGRYAFHDLIREYARGLGAPRSGTALRDRYLAAAAKAADLLSPDTRRVGPAAAGPPMSDVDAALAWLDAERATLLTYEGDWELACVLRPYFEHRGLFAEWRRTHEHALRATEDPTARVLLRFGLGALEMWTGRVTEGMEHLRRALRSDVDDPGLEAAALASLGMLAHLGHRDVEATAHLRRSIEISTSPRTTALALNNLGLTRGRLGERDAALTLHRRALAMARGTGSASAERAVLLGFGETALRLGWPAAGHFRAARDLARAGRFRMQEALALDGLAHATGDPEAARQAWAIAGELGVATLHCEQCRVAPPLMRTTRQPVTVRT